MLDGAAEHLRASSLIPEEAYFYSVTEKNTVKKRFFRFFNKFITKYGQDKKFFLKKGYSIHRKFYTKRLLRIG